MKQHIINDLKKIVGENYVSVEESVLIRHSKDKSFHAPQLPDVVVFPKSTDEVSRVVKIANANNIPITPWGGGTSLMGNSIPVKKGISLNMTLMNQVLEVMENSFQTRLQPGIICDDLNEFLAGYNLFFPAFPGSSNLATIGGVIANNSGGMYAVKYGVVGDWVMELQIVMSDGKVTRIGSRSIKSVSGYNLLKLFVGSSGTLGIITEAVLKLLPLPKTKMAVLTSFKNLNDVSSAIMEILAEDIRPAALEHMDRDYVKLVNQAQAEFKLKEQDTLLIELHGTEKTLEFQMKILKKICKKNNASVFEEFRTPEECNRLWACRKGIRLAFYKISPNTGILSAEAGVPLSFIPQFIKRAKELQTKYNIPILNHGHVGDGNFHAWALYSLDDPKSLKKAEKVNEDLTRFAISVGGTATGEHGIGLGKKQFLELEHPTSLPIMKNIKQLLDPKGILNPGKIFA